MTNSEIPSHGSTPSRREIVRQGAKLAFIAPLVMTFSATEAFAAGSNHSCYPAGHVCPGAEPCCGTLACNNGKCGDPCVATSGLCFVDSDCCSGSCSAGICD